MAKKEFFWQEQAVHRMAFMHPPPFPPTTQNVQHTFVLHAQKLNFCAKNVNFCPKHLYWTAQTFVLRAKKICPACKKSLGAIQIIRDTFLDNFRPPPPPCVIWWHIPVHPPPRVTWHLNCSKNYVLKHFLRQNTSIFFKKMSRDILANPLPPPCDIWWHNPVPPPIVSRIIWMAPYSKKLDDLEIRWDCLVYCIIFRVAKFLMIFCRIWKNIITKFFKKLYFFFSNTN